MLPVGIEGRRPVSESVHPIAPGETLLLFTDGLVERRRESISVGLERLAQALRGAPAGGRRAVRLRRLADDVGRGSTSDDIALLAVTLLPAR